MVLAAWSATGKDISENLVKLGGQWLLTPNYTAKERRNIMESNWPKLIDFINSQPKSSWYPNINKSAEILAAPVRLNNILQGLLKSNASMVEQKSGALNISNITKAFSNLDAKEKVVIEKLADELVESRLQLLLKILVSNKETKKVYLKKMDRHMKSIYDLYSGYEVFEPQIIEHEIEVLNEIVR